MSCDVSKSHLVPVYSFSKKSLGEKISALCPIFGLLGLAVPASGIISRWNLIGVIHPESTKMTIFSVQQLKFAA